ncbi:DUF1285 domain-containing protein [Psychrobacter sp. DAB_AL32B]|uniref:DUF1285 domain-containing protein n=1 Tax=Psychrobacter sp. DAB_AL32B TaxID=1028414 RepID=UPI000B7D6B41|nr:DUF1285 domain-containing protein [Psychrobacter sp. DAB_AL32B]OXL17810.1 hypothetical protein CAN34_13305 [Psychrobacter sp. DAB_AL32B]
MNDNNKSVNAASKYGTEAPSDMLSELNNVDALSQYFKSAAGTREGRAIPPLEKWHPEQVADMDLIIKANGEWWHEGGHMTRESLVNLFATILWKEENNGTVEYFLKTPAQKLRIQVEDAPLLINDVGIVNENDTSWLEFTTTTGDVVRLDDEHPISLNNYIADGNSETNNANSHEENNHEENKRSETEAQIRPYMTVRNGLTALIGRNAFYHLTDIGELTERDGETILTLQSGGKSYQLSMPAG